LREPREVAQYPEQMQDVNTPSPSYRDSLSLIQGLPLPHIGTPYMRERESLYEGEGVLV